MGDLKNVAVLYHKVRCFEDTHLSTSSSMWHEGPGHLEGNLGNGLPEQGGVQVTRRQRRQRVPVHGAVQPPPLAARRLAYEQLHCIVVWCQPWSKEANARSGFERRMQTEKQNLYCQPTKALQ